MRRNSPARKAAVAVTGGTLVATGVALLPLPGPGTVVILAGLGVLAGEFPAAQRTLDRARDTARRVRERTGTTGRR